MGLGDFRHRLAEHVEHRLGALRIHGAGQGIHGDRVLQRGEIELLVGADDVRGHLGHDFLRRMAVDPVQRSQDGIRECLNLAVVACDPCGAGVQRSAGIFAAEYFERILLGASVAQDPHVLIFALQQRDGRIEHDGRVDQPLLLCGNRGRVEADADDRHRIRIDAVLVQQVFQEEIGR